MKRKFLARHALICVGLISVLLLACQKQSVQPSAITPNGTSSSERSQAIARSNNLVLKTFTRNNRNYNFVYAPNGVLDSIVVTGDHPYVYRVSYKGSRLDSVILVDNGRIVSTIRNFEYKGNLITHFDYFDRIDNFPFPWTYSFAYDAQKRIVSIERSYQDKVVSRMRFSYDASDNIATLNDFISKEATYSYDSELNPLHLVPDLFAVMVEEQWIWEYSFSLHNSVSKAYLGGQSLVYQNQYNSSGQLVKKLFSDNSNIFSFTYK